MLIEGLKVNEFSSLGNKFYMVAHWLFRYLYTYFILINYIYFFISLSFISIYVTTRSRILGVFLTIGDRIHRNIPKGFKAANPHLATVAGYGSTPLILRVGDTYLWVPCCIWRCRTWRAHGCRDGKGPCRWRAARGMYQSCGRPLAPSNCRRSSKQADLHILLYNNFYHTLPQVSKI